MDFGACNLEFNRFGYDGYRNYHDGIQDLLEPACCLGIPGSGRHCSAGRKSNPGMDTCQCLTGIHRGHILCPLIRVPLQMTSWLLSAAPAAQGSHRHRCHHVCTSRHGGYWINSAETNPMFLFMLRKPVYHFPSGIGKNGIHFKYSFC